jgi:hypothetical protein
MEVENSSYSPEQKGKHLVERSSRSHATTTRVLPYILEGVCVMDKILGYMEKLRYSDHDVTDTEKFLELAKKVYLDTVGIGHFSKPINQSKQWASRLANTGILIMLDILHFGRGQDVNNYIKKMMAVTHRGYLWVEETVSIDVDLIMYITWLPYGGRDLHSSSMKK